MKRRPFLVASGSAILTGTGFSELQKSALGLDFEIENIPDKNPSNVDSILLDFNKF